MVRLKGRDDLRDLQGALGAGFRAASLASLHIELLSAAPEDDKKSAAQVLDQFYKVAVRLCSREKEFNRRARPAGAPTVMNHLRGSAHLNLLREFNDIKQSLLALNPGVGQKIVRLVERDIDVTARTYKPSAIPGSAI